MQPRIWRLHCQNLWQVCLLTLPGYSHTVIIFQAASAAPAALMRTPVGQPISPDILSVQQYHLSLAERQHVFMQGVHTGMQLNAVPAADVQASYPGAGASITDSWPNFQPGLPPLAPAAGRNSLLQYLNSAVETQVGGLRL